MLEKRGTVIAIDRHRNGEFLRLSFSQLPYCIILVQQFIEQIICSYMPCKRCICHGNLKCHL